MELTTTPLSRRKGGRVYPAQTGFTLIELLVVIGIMVTLIAILLPMLSKARAAAQRTAIASDLVGIGQALDQYKHDWGDYPRTTMDKPPGATIPCSGAVTLCWALLAPGPASPTSTVQVADGADGPGFRIRGTQGKVYGPYLNVDHYRYGTLVNPTGGAPAVNLIPNGQPSDDSQTVIADSQGNAILYFPGNTSVSLSGGSSGMLMGLPPRGAPVSAQMQFVYNFNDNMPPLTTSAQPTCSLTPKIFTIQLGGSSGTPVIQPFLLLSAGHDGQFGPPVENGLTIGDSDDVAYPDQLNPVPLSTAP
ncbi:MAG TPA: prepilin-type N-terminal cleavage/methylation domain-containing protein [Tepidisphaeraceae bacterium]|jgi:general secretion pathway protein G